MKWLQTTLVAAALLPLAACQTVHTTSGGAVGVDREQRVSVLVSSAQVEAMSAQAYQEELAKARAAGTLNRDAAQVARVKRISQRLIAQVPVFRPDAAGWPWEVNLQQSEELNAYCMAGGKIMVYSGLIDQLKLSDDELAQVIGHEISHALREHSRERISEQQNRGMLLQLGSILTSGKYDDYLKLGNQGAELLIALPNSREQEVEADRIGLELAARAGYNPRAAISLWQKMLQAGGATPPEFLSTHPSGNTRLRELEALIPKVMPLYQNARK